MTDRASRSTSGAVSSLQASSITWTSTSLGAVTITLFEGHDTSAGDVACIDIALLKKVVIQLDAPVGDRRIVDGAA